MMYCYTGSDSPMVLMLREDSNRLLMHGTPSLTEHHGNVLVSIRYELKEFWVWLQGCDLLHN